MGKRIAILVHENHQRIREEYMVDTYAKFWREDGHEVLTVVGIKEWVPADLVIVHVDLSVVPQEYLDFAARYPAALNARVRDIRKSFISHQLLKRGEVYNAPVIVKSDLNFGGVPDFVLGARHTRLFKGPWDYKIFPSLAAVPGNVFDHSDVVVEKFLPEHVDGLYYMRAMVFVGDRVSCTRMSSRMPIVNGRTQLQVEDVEPHPEIVKRKEELGFDIGKFDYVMHEGRPVLLDTNKTVGKPPETTDAAVVAGRRFRAEGVYSFFR
jgi:hypothetical protein